MSEVTARLFVSTRKGATRMVATGQLLSTLTVRVIASVVEGETTVPYSLLIENSEFLTCVRKADTIEEVIDWVNDNY
jgi:hypothetical protein